MIKVTKLNQKTFYINCELIETMEETIKKARQEIQKIIKKLDIKKSQIIKDGYTKMLWDLKKIKVTI